MWISSYRQLRLPKLMPLTAQTHQGFRELRVDKVWAGAQANPVLAAGSPPAPQIPFPSYIRFYCGVNERNSVIVLCMIIATNTYVDGLVYLRAAHAVFLPTPLLPIFPGGSYRSVGGSCRASCSNQVSKSGMQGRNFAIMVQCIGGLTYQCVACRLHSLDTCHS